MRALHSSVWVVVLCGFMVPVGGCGPVLPFAVWIGKVVLHTAAVRTTVRLIDTALGQGDKEVSNEVKRNPKYPDDMNRGLLPSLEVRMNNSDGTPSTETVKFTNVPVIRNADKKWVVESTYADQEIEPKLTKIEPKLNYGK